MQAKIDKHLTFHHKSNKKAGNVRSFPGPAALYYYEAKRFTRLHFSRIMDDDW